MREKNKVSDLNTTARAVLALTANALFDARRPVPEEIDWQQVYEECCHQAVPALGMRGAQAAGVPEDILQKWKQTVIASAYNNLRVSWEHNELDRLMKSAEIPYVVLKGCASALYYPDPSERVMGDVDFLVRKEDMERAGKVLEQEGFVPWDEEHICHVVYRRPPTHYEMHFEPACFLQALFPQKCRLNSSKLHGEFPQYCISSAGTLSGAGEEPLQAYKVY